MFQFLIKKKDEHPHVVLEYNRIDDNIYIGTNQCCQVHFDQVLQKEGISADISLEENRVDQPFGVVAYSWIPVKDGNIPTPDQFEYGIRVIEELIRQGRKVYVHCKNGHGRAPTLVAAYLIRKKGLSAQSAIDLIHRQRPPMHLSDRQLRTLANFS